MEDWRKRERRSELILTFCVGSWISAGLIFLLFSIYQQAIKDIFISLLSLVYPVVFVLLWKGGDYLYNKMNSIDAFWETKKGQIIQNWIVSPIMLLGLVFIGSQDERVMSIIRKLFSFF